MRQILLTASIVLSAAGAASAQVVFPPAPAPAPAPLPRLAPPVQVAPIPPAAPIVTVNPGDFHVNVDLDLTSLKDHAQWEVASAKWAEEGARWAAESAKWAEQSAQAVNFAFAEQSFQPFQKSTQVDGLYQQARSYIDNNQYDRALNPLDRVIAAKAERADAAMYWKSYTFYKLARRDEAVATVNQLAKEFPQSPWVRDARALEVEIKQSAGQPVGADAADDEIKLLAMQGLMRTDPEAALPVIEKVLAGGANVRTKERALYVLSQNRSDRARAVIAGVARGNANPDLQRTAIRLLAQSNSPESIAVLSSLYRPEQSIEIRRTIINSLGQNHNNAAANNALITIYRAERDSELRAQIVRHLSDCRSAECKAFLTEVITK